MNRKFAIFAVLALAGSMTARAEIIDAGGAHTCAIVPGGAIKCWGNDSVGQTGNDMAMGSVTLVPTLVDTSVIGPQVFTSVAAGELFSCGLAETGKLFCWGGDGSGEIGDGDPFTDQPIPVPVFDAPAASGEHWTQITAGSSFACGLDSAGGAWCWGADNYGQMGDGDGETVVGRPVPISMPPGRSFSSVSAGALHACAVDDLGGAWCWGAGFFGQLGDGGASGPMFSPTTVQFLPAAVQQLPKPLKSISSGLDQTCGLDVDGQAWCWGYNGSGELGYSADFLHSDLPVAVQQLQGLEFVLISAGAQMTCALDTAQGVWCWGSDMKGQLGNDDVLANAPFPVAVASENLPPDVEAVTAGREYACAAGRHGAVSCWGSGKLGQLGGGYGGNAPVPAVVDGVSAQDIAAGFAHTCTLSADDVVMCWGSNEHGQLGVGSDAEVVTLPATVDADVFDGASLESITAGDHHTCVLDDEGMAWCWGTNTEGQLGTVDTLESNVPVAVDLAPIDAMSRKLVALKAGGNNTCALDTMGDAWCWGSNKFSQLGSISAAISVSFVPKRVVDGGVSFRDLDVGRQHVCALTTGNPNGAVHCWGINSYRRMGHNIAVVPDGKKPVELPANLLLDRIDVGSEFTCASGHTVEASGVFRRIFCAGRNDVSQIYGGGFAPISFVETFSELVDAPEADHPLALGTMHSCVRSQGSGIAHCWGSNVDGQLADGTLEFRQPPANPTLFGAVEALAAGEFHTCAIVPGGAVLCAGDRSFGQLGDGKASQQPTPQPAPGLIVVGSGIFADGLEQSVP